MKHSSIQSLAQILGTALLSVVTLSVSAQAATTSRITCGYADSSRKLLEIVHAANGVTGRDLFTTSSVDGSAIRSTFTVLGVTAGTDTYEYDIRMIEKYNVGLLNENPATDNSVPGMSNIRLQLKLNIHNPENSEVHVHTRETIRDFKWEPDFLANHMTTDETRKIVCTIEHTEQQ